MIIEVPVKQVKIDEKAIIKKMLKYKHNHKTVFNKKALKASDCILLGHAYYPYWIGRLYTSKERAYINPKELYFQIVCDAIDSSYIVLRNIPKTEMVKKADDIVLPSYIKPEDFKNKIVEDAKVNRINKQFIFGRPYYRLEECKMIYIPGGIIEITDKLIGNKEEYFVNAYTGEAKKYI